MHKLNLFAFILLLLWGQFVAFVAVLGTVKL